MEHGEIEAADANVIAREDEPPICAVPDGARKGSPQALERMRSPTVVCVSNQFRVGAHRKPVATAFERVAQFTRIDQLRIGNRTDVAPVARPDTCFDEWRR